MSVRSKPNREGEAPAEPERDGSELPEGWATTTLDTLFEFKYGKGLRQDTRDETGVVSVYGSNGVVGKHASAVTSGPTIIVGRKGSVGEVHLCPEPCWPIDTTYFIDEFPCGLPPVYWANFLKSLRLGDQGKSSAIPGISRDDIYKVIVSVPPLAEQRRIVGKLELLLGKVSSSQQRLSRVPGLLKRFRQSVLAAACSGKLTADWREENQNASVADELNNLAADLDQETTEVEELPLIPTNWIWARAGQVFSTRQGVQIPRSEQLTEPTEGFTRYLYISDFKHAESLKFVQDRFPEKLVSKNDLVMANTGSPGAVFRGVPGILSNNLFKISIASTRFDQSFVFYYFKSPLFLLRIKMKGGAQQHLGHEAFGSHLIPIPPLAEQQEIVRRVEKLFAFADQIEARLKQAQAHVDRLTQSLLAKAFRGELVPTEHTLATAAGRNYEPASELLERIRTPPISDAPATTPRRHKASSSRRDTR